MMQATQCNRIEGLIQFEDELMNQKMSDTALKLVLLCSTQRSREIFKGYKINE